MTFDGDFGAELSVVSPILVLLVLVLGGLAISRILNSGITLLARFTTGVDAVTGKSIIITYTNTQRHSQFRANYECCDYRWQCYC